VCGFAGEIAYSGVPDAEAVRRMTETMCDRGPDGGGDWTSGPVALGHRRLKVIDLSATGNQPMVDTDLGLSIVFNGCIYNYPALRDELQAAGYRFFSTSDTEVILKAFDHWGSRCVDRFLGMFAFAIYEERTRRLTSCATASGSSPSTWPPASTACASPPPFQRSWPAAGSTRSSTRSRCTTSSPGTVWSPPR
jgi:asparagine synthase (glutamine-hydrolysing)